MKEEKNKQAKPMNPDEVREVVKKYMCGHLKSVSVNYVLGYMNVEVWYEDFKPERVVRDELEKILPFSRVSTQGVYASVGRLRTMESVHGREDAECVVAFVGLYLFAKQGHLIEWKYLNYVI